MNYLNVNAMGQLPPQALDAEEIVIGSMLMEPDCVPVVMEIINADAIYKEKHRFIFSAIQSLYVSKSKIDLLTVAHELIKTGTLELAGGSYELTQYTNRIGSVVNIEAHCQIVLECFIKRELIRVSSETIKGAYENTTDAIQLSDAHIASGKAIFDRISFGKTDSTDQLLIELMGDIETKTPIGPISGLKALDELIIGFEPGLKYTVGGRSSMGKSSFCKSIAINLINQGEPGIIFSMEMTPKQFMSTITSEICEIDSRRIKTKDIHPEEIKAMWAKMNRFKKELLLIDGKSAVSAEYVSKRVKKAIKSIGAKWFMTDYTQMSKVSNSKGKSKEERVGEFSQGLKDICKDENVFCLEISQLSRLEKGAGKGATKRPILADLRDSGTIEQSADTVLLLYRPEYYGLKGPNGEDVKGLTEIIVAKQRSGVTGSCYVHFTPEYTRFSNRKMLDAPASDEIQMESF